MMHPKTLSTAFVWLALVALAAQGVGAPALLDACQCQACECGAQTQKKSCCEAHSPQTPTDCGQSCCQEPSRDCTQATRIPGSCCCVEADPNVPANLPKSDKASPEKQLPQVSFALESAAARPATPSVILPTDIRRVSLPPRILYCVWRI